MGTKIVLVTLKALVLNSNRRVSISLIQRKMKLGFNASAEILDKLVEGGCVLEMGSNHYELAPEFLL